jgi:uncharacterized protein YdiU (UPF0061 family)
MGSVWLLSALLLGQTFHACVPGYFGADCAGICRCGELEPCDDGVRGTGACEPTRQVRLSTRTAALRADAGTGLARLERALVWLPAPTERLRVEPQTDMVVRSRLVLNASISAPAWPRPFREPSSVALVHVKRDLLARLGLEPADAASDALRDVLAGSVLLAGAAPFAHAYGGHQFGQWAGQLGDGRALSLGVLAARWPDGRAGGPPLELALKGAGTTLFSRAGDGRAALGNLVRELVADSALVGLGVPCVRSLALVAAGARDGIARDALYSGRPDVVPAGVLARLAPSFLRLGALQLAARTQGPAGVERVAREALRALAALELGDDEATGSVRGLARVPAALRARCFFGATRSCAARFADDGEGGSRLEALSCLLERVATRLGALLGAWTAAGFAHGVMNTDNLSLLAITLDMNVYGFADAYDPRWSPNHIDQDARYALGAQRAMGAYALARLVDAAAGARFEADRSEDAGTWQRAHAPPTDGEPPWLPRARADEAVLTFGPAYDVCFDTRMRLRLGLTPTPPRADQPRADQLVRGWTRWLERSGADYHAASRALADVRMLSADEARVCASDEPASGARERCSGAPVDLEAAAATIERTSGAHARGRGALRAWLAEYRAALVVENETDLAEPAEALEASRAARVRAHAPLFVARTAVLRELSALVEDVQTRHTSMLADALDALSQPFDVDGSWAAELVDSVAHASGLSGDDRPLRAVLQSEGEATARTLLRRKLASVPPRAERQLKTSCGAQ